MLSFGRAAAERPRSCQHQPQVWVIQLHLGLQLLRHGYPTFSFTVACLSCPQTRALNAEDSQLHQYATQALEAAAAYADHLESPPLANAAAVTPQPARTGTADASSSHQPDRQQQHNIVGGDISARPQSRIRPVSPTMSSRVNMLLSQAAAAPQEATQSAYKQTCKGQTPSFQTSTKSKKHHPLYTPASAPRQKPAQQKKSKPKAGHGFAIRQPASVPASAAPAAKAISATDALRQLINAPHQNSPALIQGQQSEKQGRTEGQQQYPGSMAELLGFDKHNDPEESVEDVDADAQDPSNMQDVESPSHGHSDSAKDLLQSMLEGRMCEAPQTIKQHVPATRTPAAPVSDTIAKAGGSATTAMTLQRQFIASLPDTAAVPTSRVQSGRCQATPGSLTARLNRVLQLEKALQAQFEAAGSLDGETLDVTIAEHRLEGHIVKCRCSRSNNDAEQVFVFFSSKLCRDVNLSAGCKVTLHAPWTDIQLPDCSIPILLCQYVSASS